MFLVLILLFLIPVVSADLIGGHPPGLVIRPNNGGGQHPPGLVVRPNDNSSAVEQNTDQSDTSEPAIPFYLSVASIGFRLIANFVINLAIIYALLYAFMKFKKKNKSNKIYSIIIITIIGLVIDWIAYNVSSAFDYLTGMLVMGLLVFVVAGLSSYLLLFRKQLSHKQAIIAAILFGIISNPVWLYLVTLLFMSNLNYY